METHNAAKPLVEYEKWTQNKIMMMMAVIIGGILSRKKMR